MGTKVWLLALVLIIAGPTGNAVAGSQSYGFENRYWGFTGDAGYTTWFSIENNDGHPAPALRIKGMSGFGMEVFRPELVGDFAAAGYGKISFDLKILSWFPQSSQPAPPLRIFLQRSNNHSPWVKVASGFSPVTGQWQRVYVDFNPAWTDAQAQASGWTIEPFGMPNATFQDTCRNIFVSGAWLKIQGPLYEGYYLIDNYSLLPPGNARMQRKTVPTGEKVRTITPQKGTLQRK